ncbi:MAG: NRDE family protein [Flavobacteriaceae bacterium]|nr:NRDE family protein [Flavobacteriaceae bacterium]
MCTVSFVVANGKTIITSNRDEKVLRPSAVEPKSYLINNKNIIFPKDAKAGGTWYAITEDATVLVLLNGADEKHQLKPSYRKSRGLIVLDIISSISPIDEWKSIDLSDIEPFTLVLFQDSKLYQLRWDEVEKSTINLDITHNHIWSSSTLYPRDIREKRANWFYAYLDTKPEVDETEMFNFHRYTEEENQENGLVINRNDSMKTLSITQAVIEKNKVVLSHYDLQQQKDFTNTFITI